MSISKEKHQGNVRQRKHWILKWPIPFSLVFPIVMLIVVSLLAVLISNVIYYFLWDRISDMATFSNDYVYSVTRICFSFLVMVFIHRFVMKEWTFGIRKIGSWKEILIFGWPAIIFGLVNITDSLFFLGQKFVGLEGLFAALLTGFAPGLFEEVLCRGVVLNNYLYQWKNKSNVILKGTIFSSIAFGVIHLSNIGSVPIADTLSQVVYAVGAGVILCALYLRTGNLLPGIIVHAFVDILHAAFTGGIEGNMFTRIEAILISFICFGVGVYLIRSEKQQEIKKRFAWIFDDLFHTFYHV